MTSLSFTVIGPPQPKERARRGKGGRWYTPERTRRYEAAVKAMASLSVPRGWPMDARYSVTVTAWFPDGRHRDVDNVLKAAQDACAGILFDNDRRVVESIARRGGIDRANPRTVVTVEVVESRQSTDKSATAARSEAR